MKKRMLCLALVLCLTLTACGGSKEDGQSQVSSLLGGAAGMEETEPLLTVDGREVPAWRYLYWLARTCDAIREEYEAAGLEVDWTASAGTTSLADYAKNQALSDTVLYATVENWAETYGCTVPAEEAVSAQAVPELGLDEARAEELADVGRLYGQLYTLFCTAGSALAPGAEALRAYAEACGWVSVDRILISTGEDRETARQRAAEIFSRLNAAEDQAAEFSALATAGDDPAGPRTVLLGDGTLDAALEDALRELEPGQCSGILESEEGFSILRRLEVNADALTEAYFDHQLQSAADAAEVQCVDAYKKLDIPGFYEALQKGRSAE